MTDPLAETMIKAKFGKVAVEQDADILSKLYAHTPQKIKLNNEVGMDWVKRNFANFPAVVEPNLSRDDRHRYQTVSTQ